MKKIIRGSKKQLKKYLEDHNLPKRWIRSDKKGYYIKLVDCNHHHHKQ